MLLLERKHTVHQENHSRHSGCLFVLFFFGMFVFYSFHPWDPVDALSSFPLALLFLSASWIPQNIYACWLVRSGDAVFTFAAKKGNLCVCILFFCLFIYFFYQCCGPIRQWCFCPVQALLFPTYLWWTSLALLSLSICSPSACPKAMSKFVSVDQMLAQVSCSVGLILGIFTKIAWFY